MTLDALVRDCKAPEQLELFVYGGCPSCDFVGYMAFVGVQEGYMNIPDIIEYNCICGTTLSKKTIQKDIEYF